MNIRFPLLLPLVLGFTSLLLADDNAAVPAAPPLVQNQSQPRADALGLPAGQQRVYAPVSDVLISRQAADGILERFRKVYNKDDRAPRVVVYVNRALIDASSGLQLASHTEHYEKTDASTKTSGENTYQVKNVAPPPLADQQTVREVERLFGRVFRNAGATLADQKTAAALLPEQAGTRLVGDQAAKEREALANIADVAVEVLISSRNLVVPEISGDVNYTVPDIQATAIRLRDAAIVGQAAASDVLGKGAQAGRVIRQFDVRDITEATAIALIEDMLTGKAEK